MRVVFGLVLTQRSAYRCILVNVTTTTTKELIARCVRVVDADFVRACTHSTCARFLARSCSWMSEHQQWQHEKPGHKNRPIKYRANEQTIERERESERAIESALANERTSWLDWSNQRVRDEPIGSQSRARRPRQTERERESLWLPSHSNGLRAS